MSTDPVKPGAGPSYFGRYQYAFNNPYRYTDPTGMFTEDPDADNDPDGGWSEEDKKTWTEHADGSHGNDRPNRNPVNSDTPKNPVEGMMYSVGGVYREARFAGGRWHYVKIKRGCQMSDCYTRGHTYDNADPMTAAFSRALAADELTRAGDAVDGAAIAAQALPLPQAQVAAKVATAIGAVIDLTALAVQSDPTNISPSVVGQAIESTIGGKVGVVIGSGSSIIMNHRPDELRSAP